MLPEPHPDALAAQRAPLALRPHQYLRPSYDTVRVSVARRSDEYEVQYNPLQGYVW